MCIFVDAHSTRAVDAVRMRTCKLPKKQSLRLPEGVGKEIEGIVSKLADML